MVGRESLNLVGDPQAARAALSPLRLQLLDHLREPASAAALVGAGERRRRGFVEKLYAVRPGAMMIDPMLLGAPLTDPDRRDKQDGYSAEHLVRTAARMVHDVGRMRGEAEREGRRLITFTIEADIGFSAPSEIDQFTARLTRAVADLARDYPANGDRRRFRLTATGHPAVGTLSENTERNAVN